MWSLISVDPVHPNNNLVLCCAPGRMAVFKSPLTFPLVLQVPPQSVVQIGVRLLVQGESGKCE